MPTEDSADRLELPEFEERRCDAGRSLGGCKSAPQLVGSLSESRYCALGHQCTQYSTLNNKPAKLSRYNTEGICEACRRQRAKQADNDPAFRTEEERLEQFRNQMRSEGREALPSDAERQLIAMKRRLVEELCLRRGSFWERVRDMRSRWGIMAVTAIPPTVGAPGPPECAPKAPWEGGQETEWEAFVERWNADVFSILDRTVPKYFHEGIDWWDFLHACVLYDPRFLGCRSSQSAAASYLVAAYPNAQVNTSDCPEWRALLSSY